VQARPSPWPIQGLEALRVGSREADGYSFHEAFRHGVATTPAQATITEREQRGAAAEHANRTRGTDAAIGCAFFATGNSLVAALD
jgi:hypothetical protein